EGKEDERPLPALDARLGLTTGNVLELVAEAPEQPGEYLLKATVEPLEPDARPPGVAARRGGRQGRAEARRAAVRRDPAGRRVAGPAHGARPAGADEDREADGARH